MQRLRSAFKPALRFGVDVALNGGAAIAAQGATLLVGVLVARSLGPTSYAQFGVMLNTLNTLASFAQFGLAFTATTYVARSFETNRALATGVSRVAITYSAVLALVLAFAIILLHPVLAAHLYGDPSVGPYLTVAAIALPLATWNLVAMGILAGKRAYRSIAVTNVVGAIILIPLVVLSARLSGALLASIAFAGVVIVRGLASLWEVKRVGLLLGESVSLKVARQHIAAFAIPAGLTGLTMAPSIWLSNAWLVREHGLDAFGIFAAAFMIKTLIVFIPQQIGAVFLPRYINRSAVAEGRVNADIYGAAAVIFLLTLILCGGFWVISRPLMSVFGPRFASGSFALGWLLLAAVGEATATILSYRAAASDQMWRSYFFYALPKDIVLLVSTMFLVGPWGATGLGAAHALAWGYGVFALFALGMIPIERRSSSR